MQRPDPFLLLAPLTLVSALSAQERTEPQVVLEDVTVEVRLYDVRDLAKRDGVEKRPAGPNLVLRNPEGEIESADFAFDRETVVKDLANVIRAFVEPPLDDEESVLAVGASHIVVSGRSAQHRWVETFLNRHRQGPPPTVDLEVELFMVPKARLGEIGLAKGTRIVEDGQEEALLTALRGDGIDRMSAPRIALRAFSHVSMSSLTQTSYIKDFEVETIEIDGKKQQIADPVIDVVRDGIVLEGTSGELEDGLLGVDLGITLMQLERPIPTFSTTLGVGTQPVTIQLPQVSKVEARLTARITDGGRVVLTAPLLDDRYPVLVVRSRLVVDAILDDVTETIQEAPRNDGKAPGSGRR